MDLKTLIGNIPTVRAPEKALSVEERIKWTAAAGFLFLLMGFLPLPVSSDSFPFFFRQYYAYSNTLSILAIGIGPIIAGILLLQIPLRFRLLKIDFSDLSDRRFFYGLQKIFIVFIAVLEAFAFVAGFRLADTFPGYLGLVSVMVAGTLALLYLDEIVVKWGLGSGLGLFLALGAAKVLLIASYSILSSFLSQIIYFGRYDIESILPFFFTILFGWLIYRTLQNGKAFDVSSKASAGRYLLVLFFASFIGAEQFSFVDSYLRRLASNDTGSILPPLFIEYSNLLLPENWHQLLDFAGMINLAVWLSIIVAFSFVLGYLWAWLYGFTKLVIQPPGFRLKDSGKEQEIRTEINRLIPLSILVGILLTPLSKMFFVITGFLSILILVGYLNRCREEVYGPKKACPNCRSLGIEWLVPASWCMWECRNCGYRGAIVVDLDKNG